MSHEAEWDKAIEVLNTKGWAKFFLYDEQQGYCALGAIGVANGIKEDVLGYVGIQANPIANEMTKELAAVIKEHALDTLSGCFSSRLRQGDPQEIVHVYNDRICDNKEQLITMMEKARGL